MDALFGGCSIAGALIASGKYQFEPLTPSRTQYSSDSTGYAFRTITEHDIFIVLAGSYGPSNANTEHESTWIGVGSAAIIYAAYLPNNSSAPSATTIQCSIIDGHTIELRIPYASTTPIPALGYIYKL